MTGEKFCRNIQQILIMSPCSELYIVTSSYQRRLVNILLEVVHAAAEKKSNSINKKSMANGYWIGS